ncbi:right-handed parallel beta-helix repeat-containing protein [Saccharopolyspora gregorii]|uniref:Right-handed parallel beta-helix repeat-containing protein n=1 Tax=Saccharopolyspora gregorii TaxID=33914 RepID=A0ABP6RP57_9PSEU
MDPGHYVDPLFIQGDVHIRAAEGVGSVVIEAPPGFGSTGFGTVTLTDLVLSSRSNVNLLTQRSGRLLLERCALWAMSSPSVYCQRGAQAHLRDCEVHAGRLVFDGGGGEVARTRFADAINNAVAIVDGAQAEISHCKIEKSRFSAVMVSDAFATIKHTEVVRSGHAAIAALDHAQVSVAECELHDLDAAAVFLHQGSRGTIEDVSINNAETGILVQEQADPEVRRCTIIACRDSGINVHDRGRGAYEDCTITDSGNVGVFVHEKSAARFQRTTVRGGVTGVSVLNARAAFNELNASEMENLGLYATEGASVECTSLAVDRCGGGLLATGDLTRVRAVNVQINDVHQCGVLAQGSARVEISDVAILRPGTAGFDCSGESRTHVRDAEVDRAGLGGVGVAGSAHMIAQNLTLTNSERYGFFATEKTHVELVSCTFRGNNDRDLLIKSVECAGRIQDCAIDVEVHLENSLISRPGAEDPADGASSSRDQGGQMSSISEMPGRSADVAPIPGPLAELDRLIGLGPVKEQVKKQINMVRIATVRQKHGMAVAPVSRHLIFSGPPGTGKTTVARLYGRILTEIGALANGQVREVSRTDLVGGYLGHTAKKTREAFESASGGVLFIDEAYALARQFGANADFGQESIDELIKLMEDCREDVVVIAAGYPDEMKELLDSNPGLRSRFARIIDFPAYSPSELLDVIKLMAQQHNYGFSEDALIALFVHFSGSPRSGAEGNARHARTLFEQSIENQAMRLSDFSSPTEDQLYSLEAEDIPSDG